MKIELDTHFPSWKEQIAFWYNKGMPTFGAMIFGIGASNNAWWAWIGMIMVALGFITDIRIEDDKK